MAASVIVRATGIEKSFGPTRVLAGVDLDVRKGTVFALLGPNGAGKTTMVRILSTLLRPDAGTAVVAGYDVVRQAADVRGAISLTGQYAALDDLLTGAENLLLAARLWHLRGPAARRRTADLLDQFDLGDARDRRVKTYSGGMRRRLDLAMSLVPKPAVVFLDEPTTGLDPRSRQATWTAVGSLLADGVTVFLTTQYLEEADRLADHVMLIDDGKPVAQGTPEALKAHLAGERVDLTFPDDEHFERARGWLSGGRSQTTPQAPPPPADTATTTAAVRLCLRRGDRGRHRVRELRRAWHHPALRGLRLGHHGGQRRQ